MSKEDQLKVFSYRADEDKVKFLQEKNIDIAQLIRGAIDKAVFKSSDKCPTCGQKRKQS